MTELEQAHEKLDQDISQLANFTMRNGVGRLGWSSKFRRQPSDKTEWATIFLKEPALIDQIVLVPVIWRESENSYQADGFPIEFQVIVGLSEDDKGSVVATITQADELLPRVAPFVINIPPTQAEWIKVEATQLSPRLLDGFEILQLSEIMVFSGEANVALNQPVKVSSFPVSYQRVRAAISPDALTDGIVPYLMDTAQGNGSFANVMFFKTGDDFSLLLDLGKEYSLNQICLHVDNINQTVPRVHYADYGIPMHMKVWSSTNKESSDAKLLVEYQRENAYTAGPILTWYFPETNGRYLRFEILDGYETPEHKPNERCISFSEIEVYSADKNVALNLPVDIPFDQIINNYTHKNRASLTDGRNFFGKVISVRTWINQLATRHDLQKEREMVENALSIKYEQQKRNLRNMSWLAGLLATGIILSILTGRIIRLQEVAAIKTRFAADLHDELGANLHAIGLLSDVAMDAEEKSDLDDLHERIRDLSQQSASSVRNCTNMIESRNLDISLSDNIRRLTERMATNLKYDISIDGEQFLDNIPPQIRIDLVLFYKECLVNICRHSGATEITVRLAADRKNITLNVWDNGIGIDSANANGAPSSLKRRARLLKGKLTVCAPPDGGTEVSLIIRQRHKLI